MPYQIYFNGGRMKAGQEFYKLKYKGKQVTGDNLSEGLHTLLTILEDEEAISVRAFGDRK